uniref:Uncharacterized protein n=1 Tax=Glycine max TaxID=3847 RepID=C6TL63_SOYBN|nr:unknown [Glycine max]
MSRVVNQLRGSLFLISNKISSLCLSIWTFVPCVHKICHVLRGLITIYMKRDKRNDQKCDHMQ